MSQINKSTQPNRLPQTWNKYMQLELEEEVFLKKNEVMIVNHPNNFKQTLTFVQTMLTDQPEKQITLKSKGQAMMKAVKIAEILKRKIPELHQINKIESYVEKKHFIPLEEGLDEVILSNETVYLKIKLFINQNEIIENEPGYQAPIEQEEFVENDRSSVRNATSKNTSFNQTSFNSKQFSKSKQEKDSTQNVVQDDNQQSQNFYPPFNNQMQMNPMYQQMMLNQKGVINNQQFQPQQYGQFMPNMINPQQLPANKTSEFNLDQSEKSDEDSYESDSDQEDNNQQKMFEQFQQNQMNQHMNFQGNNNPNFKNGRPQKFNNQMMMQNPAYVNQLMMQNKNVRQINMQNAMSSQYNQFQNRNNHKKSQKNYNQFPNQNQRFQNNNRGMNNNNRNKNNNKNQKKNNNNNYNRNNKKQGQNSQSFQSNNSFAHKKKQQKFNNNQKKTIHQNSIQSQSSKNMRQMNRNQMTQSQQNLNSFNMVKQNQPINIGQQNISQQQIMQMLAHQQLQQRNNQQKIPFNPFAQQGQMNQMFPSIKPNKFLQKDQVPSEQDESSNEITSSDEDYEQAKKKPNMLKQRIMMKNEKNQQLKKQSTDQSQKQALQRNQIGQNLFAQNTQNLQQQQIPKNLQQMMQSNIPQQNFMQQAQNFPQQNQQQIQNLRNIAKNQTQKKQVEDNQSEETDSEDQTESEEEENVDQKNNNQKMKQQFTATNQTPMNYFMKMNQQKVPMNNNPNFAPQFPPYMQTQNLEEMQKKMMLQQNQFQMFPNIKANLSDDDNDSEESDDSEEQSDN